MSTTPLTDAINALTTYSNTVTGASDTTLSDAVATLAAGYGGGGGGGAFTLIDTVTLESNSRTMQVDFTAEMLTYDLLLIVLDGQQVSADWIYFALNSDPSTSGNNYSTQQQPFKFPYLFMRSPQNNYEQFTWYGRLDEYFTTAKSNSVGWSGLSYFKFKGYSKDIVAGTKAKIYGAKFSEL